MNDYNETGRLADPSNISVWPTALRWGGITALVLIIIGLLVHLSGMNDPAKANPAMGCGIGCLNYLIMGVGIVLAIKNHRDKELGGAITFGRGFGMGAATTLVIALAVAIWTYISMAFIFPEAIEMIREQMMQNAQPGQEELMETMASMFASAGGASMMGLVMNGVFGCIIALIAAAIMKKDPAPNV
jgi:hypothetical protein